jgi:hypothetical protein
VHQDDQRNTSGDGPVNPMNIFYLHPHPHSAAIMLADVHVSKMTLETGQLLSTFVRNRRTQQGVSAPNYLYRVTHESHPCAMWLGYSEHNVRWLMSYFKYIGSEYTYRYGKMHKTVSDLYEALHDELTDLFDDPLGAFDMRQFTTPALAMPDKFKAGFGKHNMPTAELIGYRPDIQQAVMCYREYYRHGKRHLLKYDNRRPAPNWLNQ